MKTKTIVIFDQHELNTIHKVQNLMSEYMEQLDRVNDSQSELCKNANNVFQAIEGFFLEYEEIVPAQF